MAGCRGYFDRPRRHDLPRSGCCARHGYLLCIRLRRYRCRLCKQAVYLLAGKTVKEGDYVSIDGTTGNIYLQAIPTVAASISGDFDRFMKWAGAVRKLEVYTNADTPRDAKQAATLAHEGIGLCRTEHMFFEETELRQCAR